MAWGIPEQLDFTPKHILRHNGGYVVVGVDGLVHGLVGVGAPGLREERRDVVEASNRGVLHHVVAIIPREGVT